MVHDTARLLPGKPVLIVAHGAALLGAEQFTLTITRFLQETGRAVHVTVPEDGPLQARLEALPAQVTVINTPWWCGARRNPLIATMRLLAVLFSLPTWVRLMVTIRPSFVWTQSAVIPSAALVARILGIRHVWLVQETVLTNRSLSSSLPRSAILRIIGRRCQVVEATCPSASSWVKTSRGVRKPRVCRGRSLSSSAMALR